MLMPPVLVTMLVESIAAMLTELPAYADFGAHQDQNLLAKVNQNVESAAVLGFTGDRIRGSLVVSGAIGVISASHPGQAMGMPVGEEDALDWLGELANQGLGRLKNRLLPLGLTISMGTPAIVKGQLKLHRQGEGASVCVEFRGKSGTIAVILNAVVESGVDFGNAVEGSGVKEGETLLF